MDPTSEAARRLYVGNIPRTATNDDLQKVFEEHGDVEKVESSSCRLQRLVHLFCYRCLQMWSTDCRRFTSEKTNNT
ncbi:putative RNA recognition motif domain, nucleotide-binding alpha-beta plait domain superfamily [Helianthus debilis subsp. tardiflorus]